MTKEAYLELKLNEPLIESRGLDLLTMGEVKERNVTATQIPSSGKFADSLSKKLRLHGYGQRSRDGTPESAYYR